MVGALKDFALVRLGEPGKVHGITGDTEGEMRVFLGMLVSLAKSFRTENVDVEMMRTLRKIAVKKRGKVAG